MEMIVLRETSYRTVVKCMNQFVVYGLLQLLICIVSFLVVKTTIWM
eukprot:UN16131